MGYNIREGVVEQHAEHLEAILQGVSKNHAISFNCDKLSSMNKMKYQFLRILKATDMLPNECGGRYHGLRAQVRVREDWQNRAVVIEPVHVPYRQGGVSAGIIPAVPNEHDMIEKLKQFEGQMDLVHFTPTETFNLDIWQLKLKTIGFDLVADPDAPGWIGEVKEDGSAEYAVARMKDSKPTGFSMLDYQPSGDMSKRG